MIRMLFSSEGEYIVRVMRCANVVFICVSLHPSLWRKLSISSSRMACRHTPLGAYLTGISMLDAVHINQTLCLLARLFHGGLHCVYATILDHLIPELSCLALDELIIVGKWIAEQVLLSIVLIHIAQALADVADILWTVSLFDEAHVQHNTASYATRQVTERLLDAVLPVVALSPRVVSWLRYEMHSGGKDTDARRNSCVLQFGFREHYY